MNNKLQTILIVEDNKINRKILAKMLSTDYEVLEAENGKVAVDIIDEKSDEISAILLDIVMPVMNGYEVLEYLKNENLIHIPIVVMTGDTDSKSEEKALDLGAWDFVSKPYQPRVLFTRLKNAIARSKMNYLQQIQHVAEHDRLTDLYNRRHFFETTEKMVRNHDDEECAFIRIDINRFQLINSFWGEAGGDELLKYIASQIRDIVSKYEWYAYGRIESDVFGFCIPYDEEICHEDLTTMIENISGYNKEYEVEPSFGIYRIEDHLVTAETMYMCATLAAKQCKHKFMTYISFYDEKMSQRVRQEQEITHEMQQALDNEEFLVYFQPKYNTQTKTPYGAEALVRWKHPDKGMISPGLFIPVFEQNGFVGKLDYYIWEKVCMYIRKWIDMGIHPAPVSVNMSRAEITNPQLVEMLTGLTRKYDIPTSLLNLELTESAYMDNPDAINNVIFKLHEAGFIILMDDFGSGYSSLNTLKDIEVDILKIDMKFLSLDEENVKSKKILASVICMARWIGLPVVTEGVETEEQYNFLQSIGCEYIQGYYFAKPMPVSDYEKLIIENKPIEAETNLKDVDSEFLLPQGIKEKIYRDELTGAYNRRYLNEWLFLDLEDDLHYDVSLGLVLVDIKSFKKINDTDGHLAGDEVLQKVAAALMKCVRKNDTVIRYGGDEFIIIFTSCHEEIVRKKMEELRAAVNDIKLCDTGNVFSGANFGYSYVEAFHKNRAKLNEMIQLADEMMYKDKQGTVKE